jgi:hypothetical protein
MVPLLLDEHATGLDLSHSPVSNFPAHCVDFHAGDRYAVQLAMPAEMQEQPDRKLSSDRLDLRSVLSCVRVGHPVCPLDRT